MNMHSIEMDLLIAIDALKNQLPDDQLAIMRDLTKAGEAGAALEALCTQLYEIDIQVTVDVLSQLRNLGQAMGIQSKYWERL